MLRTLRKGGRTIAVAAMTAVVFAGIPAAAHYGPFKHTWEKHFRKYADARYHTKIKLRTSDGNGPNSGSKFVHWNILTGVPAEFADGTDAVGPPAWQLAGNSGTTAGTNFLGTTDDEPLEFKVNGARALRLEPGITPNFIGGHPVNSITAGVQGGTIGGGGGPTDENEVTDNHGTVGGGRRNRAGDAAGTVSDRTDATVGGGLFNVASGAFSTISGGDFNTTTASASTVVGGELNIASGMFATVVGGFAGAATLYGQVAHASGGFGTPGAAQASEYVLWRAGVDATQVEIFLDGSTERLTLASDRTLKFDASIAARSNAGESAGYEVTGVIENLGGTTAFVGTPTVTEVGEDDSAWTVVVQADNSNDALVFKVTGNTGDVVRWVATVDTAEVAF